MMRKLDRQYVLTATEVRDAIFYYLSKAHGCPVPDKYDDAVITWDDTHKVYISWDESAEILLTNYKE